MGVGAPAGVMLYYPYTNHNLYVLVALELKTMGQVPKGLVLEPDIASVHVAL